MREEAVKKITIRVVVLVGAAAISTAGVSPQETTSTTTSVVEVATVKLHKSGDTNGVFEWLPGGRLIMTNRPLRPLILFAYQLGQYQLVGGPTWVSTDRFDIVAKMQSSVGPVIPGTTTEPLQSALQALLAEQFKLKVHREMREMDIYALGMVKSGIPGPGLKPSTSDCTAQTDAARRGATPPTGGPFCGLGGGSGRLRFGGLPASQIAFALTPQAGRLVVDRTGLMGLWDFDLTFSPASPSALPLGASPDQPSADPNTPSFFTAVREQLGLKLESTKGPVEVLVIDAIEKPKEE